MPRPDHNSSSLIIVLAPSEAGVEKNTDLRPFAYPACFALERRVIDY